jgi:hypothetical protein
VGVRCDLEHLAEAARREEGRLGVKDVQLACGDLDGDDPGARPVDHQEI